MAVLNPPRVITGLGRSIVNFLIENRSAWDDPRLVEAFKPAGVNDDANSADGVRNTLSAFRAIRIIETLPDGSTAVATRVTAAGHSFSRTEFRRLMLRHVFDLDRDGDPWSVPSGEGLTSGARDLSRALSWFLAQDALGEPLSWANNVEQLQNSQFASSENERWALVNDTRWNAFSRWAPALGLATPSMVRAKPGLTPLPTIAVSDVIDELQDGRIAIFDLLDLLADRLPVLPGGLVRNGLAARLGSDPDPGLQAHALDSSLAQVFRILEARGRLRFESLADAEGVQLSPLDQARTTHVTMKSSRKR